MGLSVMVLRKVNAILDGTIEETLIKGLFFLKVKGNKQGMVLSLER